MLRFTLLVTMVLITPILNSAQYIQYPVLGDQVFEHGYSCDCTIYIQRDGSVEPSNAPIVRINDTYYRVVDNISALSINILKENIVLDGGNNCLNLSRGIHVSSQNTTIKNLYVFNGWEAKGSSSGIEIFSDNVTIVNATVKGYRRGVSIESSQSIEIRSSIIEMNDAGIMFSDWVERIIIENNTFINNTFSGLILPSFLIGHSNISIVDNVFINDSLLVFYMLPAFTEKEEGWLKIVNNTVDGKPLVLLYGVNNETFHLKEFGELVVLDSYNLTFINNTFSASKLSIYVYDSENVLFVNNTFKSRQVITDILLYEEEPILHYTGLVVIDSNGVEIVNNTFYNILFTASRSDSLTINSNVFESTLKTPLGIIVLSSRNPRIVGNQFIRTGLFVADIANYTIEGNIVNNKPLLLLENIINATIEGEDYGEIILINARESSIVNTKLSDTLAGIVLLDSEKVTVENVVVENTLIGLYIYSSRYILVKHSVFRENMIGIAMYVCRESGFYMNNFIENRVGIYIGASLYGASKTRICLNNFIDNTKPIAPTYRQHYGFPSLYCPYPVGGNYWSGVEMGDYMHGPDQDRLGGDGIGDREYMGDRYPLVNPYSGYYKGFILYFKPVINVSTGSINIAWRALVLNGTGVWKVLIDTPFNVLTETYMVEQTPSNITGMSILNLSDYIYLEKTLRNTLSFSLTLISGEGKAVDYVVVEVRIPSSIELFKPPTKHYREPPLKYVVTANTSVVNETTTPPMSITSGAERGAYVSKPKPTLTPYPFISLTLSIASLILVTLYLLSKKLSPLKR